MKRNHLWFMIEGLITGAIQIVILEWALSVHYTRTAWVPLLGVLASTVSFFFLMRRFPGMKFPKYGLGFLAYIVTLPTWLIYSTVLSLRFFSLRPLDEGDGMNLLLLMCGYAVCLLFTRGVIVLIFYIRKRRQKATSR